MTAHPNPANAQSAETRCAHWRADAQRHARQAHQHARQAAAAYRSLDAWHNWTPAPDDPQRAQKAAERSAYVERYRQEAHHAAHDCQSAYESATAAAEQCATLARHASQRGELTISLRNDAVQAAHAARLASLALATMISEMMIDAPTVPEEAP